VRRTAAFIVVAAQLLAPAVRADEPARDWHLGLNLRPELAVHPVRIGGGVRLRSVDLVAVLDPFFWTDGIADTDFLAAWWFARGFALFGGWRPSAVDLGDGHQIQHRLLLGGTAALPDLPWDAIRARVGFEAALLLYKHGAGLPSDGLSFDRSMADHVSMGAFLQVEYASAL
jgi:hypothetical protein